MSNNATKESLGSAAARRKQRGWLWKGGIAAAALLAAGVWWTQAGEDSISATIAPVRRGPLEISVVEGGEVTSRESQEIRSEVQGRTTILSIIQEGYTVTADDIANGLILVELDSSELEDDLTQQEITYENALASLTEAREQHEIQISQNESDIHDAELEVAFARMDLERYLGSAVGGELLARLDNTTEEDEASEYYAAAAGPDGAMPPIDMDSIEQDGEIEIELDYQNLLGDPRLGGEAQQRLRDLESDITLAEEELSQAQTRHEWTEELLTEGFVTSSEEQQDRLSVQRREIQRDAAQTSRDLFRTYEFPKELESLASDYQQRKRSLERTHRQASARVAQSEANLRSQKATYDLQERRLEELKEQIEACIIRAERQGIVVYASGGRGDDPIEEGTEVRERQEILTIPDMNSMAVDVEIHESMVNRLRTGLPARVRADAYPEATLQGELTRLALVPDSGHRWLNPDLRVFPTTVAIEGSYEWLRPGMTARVEIIIDYLEDVIYAPMQAVVSDGRQRYVYVVQGGTVQVRPVETGVYNDRFIEIKSGVEEGEQVLLRPPRPEGATEDEEGDTDGERPAPRGDAAPGGQGAGSGGGQGGGMGGGAA
ncbi:MAG: efflux RND transporter periplasmic adaptor subunit [Candidatus Hydrogenedentota bacterium]